MQKLTYKAITLLYLPLAASWVLMLLEAPLINAFLARGPDPETALAAFGVALSIILVVEAPILMMLELSIALSKNLLAFRKIRVFYIGVGLAITVLGLVLFYTPLWRVILHRLMNIPPEIAEATIPALRVFVWWPLPIGWRRVYQGILITDGRTRFISIATAVRIAVVLAAMIFGGSQGLLPGATLAAAGMLLGVIVETSLTHWAAYSTIKRTLSRKLQDAKPLTFRYLWAFYLPLAITTLLRQCIRPLISAGIASAPMAVLSLAAWPVAFSLSSIFWGPTMGLRQVTIALVDDRDSWRKVSRFVLAAGLMLSAALALVSFTPLLGVVLRQLFGLSEPVAMLAATPVRILVLLPPTYMFHALFTGLLVKKARTATVRTAKIINLGVVVLALYAGLRFGGLQGSVLAALTISVGALVEAVWLYWQSRPVIGQLASSGSGESLT